MCAGGVLETYASWAQMHVCHSCTIHFFFLHGVSNDDCFFFVPRWRWRRPCRSSGALTTTTGRSTGSASLMTSCSCSRTCLCRPVTTPRRPAALPCPLQTDWPVPRKNNDTFYHCWERRSSVQPVKIISDVVAVAEGPASGTSRANVGLQ